MSREFEAAVIAAIKPKFVVTNAAYVRVYSGDDRPAIPSDPVVQRAFFPFVVVFTSRRYAEKKRLCYKPTVVGWRAVVICAGTTPSEVHYAEEKVAEALENVRLTIGGYSSTPFEFESQTVVGLDAELDDFYTSSTVWTTVSTLAQAA